MKDSKDRKDRDFEKSGAAARLEEIKKIIRGSRQPEESLVFSQSANKAMADHWRREAERVRRGELTRPEARFEHGRLKAVKKPAGHQEAPLDPENTFVADGCTRLYSVTTLAISAVFGDDRTVAICTNFEEAKRIVEHNEFDIHEQSYHMAVIEVVYTDSLYGGFAEREQYWYVWESETQGDGEDEGRYVAVETPPGYENVVGYGIG